jgi:hypothetical protein
MRGKIMAQPSFVSLISVETLIPAEHPIRAIKRLCAAVLAEMSARFDEIYAATVRPRFRRRRC